MSLYALSMSNRRDDDFELRQLVGNDKGTFHGSEDA